MTTDHPDWFGAGEDPDAPSDPGDASTADFDPGGADWFDGIEHVDPTPEEAPWTSSPAPSAGADATQSSGRAGEGAPGDQEAAGTDRETGPAGRAGGESAQPAASSRGGRRPSQQDDSPGGFLAWLKRLLGLN
jgi:hypothetical protein